MFNRYRKMKRRRVYDLKDESMRETDLPLINQRDWWVRTLPLVLNRVNE